MSTVQAITGILALLAVLVVAFSAGFVIGVMGERHRQWPLRHR